MSAHWYHLVTKLLSGCKTQHVTRTCHTQENCGVNSKSDIKMSNKWALYKKMSPNCYLDTKLHVGRKTQHVTRRCHTREKCVPMRPGLQTLLSSTSHIIWFSFFRHCFSFHVHYSNKRLKTDTLISVLVPLCFTNCHCFSFYSHCLNCPSVSRMLTFSPGLVKHAFQSMGRYICIR